LAAKQNSLNKKVRIAALIAVTSYTLAKLLEF